MKFVDDDDYEIYVADTNTGVSKFARYYATVHKLCTASFFSSHRV